ncbi:MAG TPA: hypothetical protein PLF42_02920 [Anaerolineales bacterium]|nr:hypothetical protein [Anaerolineales bacterium]
MIQPDNALKYDWKQGVILFAVAAYVAVNLLRIGGDMFVINLNNLIVVPLALGVTFLALRLWRQMPAGTQNRSLWLGLSVGWVMWTIAELWWAVASWIGQEVPYPSWADFFWLAGYLPMYFAIRVRIRSLPKIDDWQRRAGIWGLAIAVIGFTILFILIPIIQASDPSAFLESAITMLYPLADLALVIFLVQLLFSYQQGMYGRAWQWLTGGFALFAFSDLMFAYASTAELYQPDQQLNLISTLGVDIPYNLSYLVMVFGLLHFQTLMTSFQPIVGDQVALALVPNTHVLVFTRMDDTVMSVSGNYRAAFPDDLAQGKEIHEVLGISVDESETLLKVCKSNKVFGERELSAVTRAGREQVCISGLGTFNPQGEYTGAILLIRLFAADYSLDSLLTFEEKGMVASLLTKTGVEPVRLTAIKQLLADYHQAFLSAFYNRAFAEGGSIFADAFVTELQNTLRRRGVRIHLTPDMSMEIGALSLEEARSELPALLQTAREYLVNLTDEEDVNAIVQDVRSKFNETALTNIRNFEQANAERIG